ncbi:Androgen-induced -like protein [Halotydeus destructor]|nr:Androgen-induced -like protein [Halotydeus destructor]KAI1287789.1 Androgen-induced -like protein [Halotydeus destructor]
MASGVPLLVTVNRIINFVLLTYAIGFLIYYPIPSSHPAGSKFGLTKFFTNWNAFMQMLFYGSCLYKQFTSRVKFDSRAQTKRGAFYYGLIFPNAIIVAGIFWGLFFFDRNLIFPVSIEKYLPPHINHIIHTMIIPGMLFEGAFYQHGIPKFKNGLAVMLVVDLAYVVWINYIGITTGFWVYPFISVMPMVAKGIFFAAAAAIGVALYKLGRMYHNAVWGKNSKGKVTKVKN